jgi:hypothetical protein
MKFIYVNEVAVVVVVVKVQLRLYPGHTQIGLDETKNLKQYCEDCEF